MRPDGPRDPIAGPDAGPQPPFPIKVSGEVIKGYGRGGKELGVPTANIPIEGLEIGGHADLESGVYFGWCGLDFHSTQPHHGHLRGLWDKVEGVSARVVGAAGEFAMGDEDKDALEGWDGKGRVHPMVMSVGWNPFYKNEKRSVEVHIMHPFERDFYGSHMNLLVLGFVRPEYDYVDKASLVGDIKTDVDVAGASLARPAWARYAKDPSLLDFPEAHVKAQKPA